MIASLIIAVAYLLQLASPLRLHPDAVTFFQLAISFSDGHGFTEFGGKPTRYPPGYPAFIVGLDRLHIANSFTFLAANFVFLVIGTIATFFILRRRLSFSFNAALACCNLSLLSWTVIKHVTIPLSDIPYYGLSLLVVWTVSCLENTQGSRRILLAVFSLILVVAAVLTRTIGIALLPAFLWAILGQQRESLVQVFTATHRWRTGFMVLAIMTVILAIATISHTRYGLACLSGYHDGGYLYMITSTLAWRATELGALGINIPSYNLWFGFVGLIFIAAIGCGLWLQRSPLSSLLIYVLTYLGIIIIWPYFDPRFWIPIIPLLAGYAWIAIRKGMMCWRIPRSAVLAYLAIFVVMGLAAFGYSTRISLSGDRFGDLYAGGRYKIAYDAARNHQPLENTGDEKDHKNSWNDDEAIIWHIFQRFESSCK